MRKTTLLILMVLTAGLALAEEKKYTCSMKVDAPKTETTKNKSKGEGKYSKSEVTTTRKMCCPVRVSVRGKEIPTGIRLVCIFTGKTDDGQRVMLGKRTQEVKVDEKGDYSTQFVSDPAVMTETKSNRRSGGFSSGGGGGRVSKTERSGLITDGCIIQLLVGDKVERSFTSVPQWSKFARQNPLPESEILNGK